MKLVFSFLIVLGFHTAQAAPPSSLEYYKNLKSTAFSSTASLSERWSALQEMGRGDFEWFKEDLEKALQAKEWFVRNAALIAIQSGKPEFVRKWSEKLLFDKALVVRTQAIKNLLELKSSESSETIFKALNHKMNFRGNYSLWIRPYLAQALVLHPPKNWKRVYQSMLGDRDEKVQTWAIIGLEQKSGLRLGRPGDSLEVKRQKWLNYFGIRRI